MAGVAITMTQPNGVQTTWATITYISWQPGLSAYVTIGYYISENGYTPGMPPVWSEIVPLNVSEIDPTQAIPGQLFTQLTAVGAPLYGGTLTS